jgi:hypothetical protein
MERTQTAFCIVVLVVAHFQKQEFHLRSILPILFFLFISPFSFESSWHFLFVFQSRSYGRPTRTYALISPFNTRLTSNDNTMHDQVASSTSAGHSNVHHTSGGPSAFSTWIAARSATAPTHTRFPAPALRAGEDPHEALFSAAEHSSRMSLRHLHSLRRAFGLLEQARAAAVVPVSSTLSSQARSNAAVTPVPFRIGSSPPLPHIVPDTLDQQDLYSPSAAHISPKLAALYGDETRQRRLLADMFVAQWKRLREQQEQRRTEMAHQAEQSRHSAEERKAARVRHEHDAFSSGLAFLRGSSAGSRTSQEQR